LIGRHRLFIDDEQFSEDENEIISNSKLSEYYIKLCKDLDCLKPKKPSEVYKGLSENNISSIDSAQLNLADSIVNAFVNLGTSKDSLMNPIQEEMVTTENTAWVTKVKDKGIMTTVASLGLIHLWNFEECSQALSEYIELEDGYAKAGALIAWGLCNSGIWDENDPARALLEENLESSVNCVKIGACVGLGLAYAGSSREDFNDVFCELMNDENLPTEVSANAALALSMINVSSCDEEVINLLLGPLIQFEPEMLNTKEARYFGLALALNFFGQQSEIETIIETMGCVEHPIGKETQLLIEISAYAGSGNMLKIQEMFNRAIPHKEDKEEQRLQSIALIGMALISIGEKMSTQMLFRNIHHILQYCDKQVRMVAPIMLAILGVMNPSIQITDLLYKLCFEEDKEMALRSIFALGIIGMGSNNSRIASLLRNLFDYYTEDNDYLYTIKLALGLLYSGKGLIGVSPYYSEGFLFSKTGFASLMIIAFAMLEMEHSFINNNHYLIYYLGVAIHPKMLYCLDEELKEIDAAIRVGQTVDVVGQVGKPRKITGFQTHNSPVIINGGESAELATEEYMMLGDVVLEGFIILKKNPEYEKEKEALKAQRKKTSGYF
jgi:26S proteasome regulatory subunit N1